MKAAGTVILEIAALCAIGGVLGLSVNALREKDSIRIGRNYFAPAVVAIPQPSPSTTRSDSPAAIPTTKAQADQWFVTIEEVRQLLEAPGAEAGSCVFVDARNDKHFAEGHIPGAVQLDYYNLEKYLPDALLRILAAQRVIVYCNGGDCEDSLLLRQELIGRGVPFDELSVYKGGWEEWQAAGMPVESGEVP